jgi:hypothetical protein
MTKKKKKKKTTKTYSTSMAIKEMQIKTTLRSHFTPVGQLQSRTQTTANVVRDVGKRNPHTLFGGNVN